MVKGSLLLLGLAIIDRLRQGTSQEPEQKSWERSAKIGTGKANFSSLLYIKYIKSHIYHSTFVL